MRPESFSGWAAVAGRMLLFFLFFIRKTEQQHSSSSAFLCVFFFICCSKIREKVETVGGYLLCRGKVKLKAAVSRVSSTCSGRQMNCFHRSLFRSSLLHRVLNYALGLHLHDNVPIWGCDCLFINPAFKVQLGEDQL